MKQFWLMVIVFVSFDLLWSQEVEHASTVDQSRAAQKLWFSKISDDPASISFQELNFWSLEMHGCARIEPESNKGYYQTSGDAVGTANNRLMHFLERHNLVQQFLAEDAQGKRCGPTAFYPGESVCP